MLRHVSRVRKRIIPLAGCCPPPSALIAPHVALRKPPPKLARSPLAGTRAAVAYRGAQSEQ